MAESPALIKLTVKTLHNGNHDVEVPPDIRIDDLKRRLVEVASVPFDRQRLIFRGRVLNNDDTLLEHGVGDGYTVHLAARPADAPVPLPGQPQGQHGSQGNSARISVNVGSTGGPGIGVNEISRMVQGVMRAVGIEGQMPLQVQMGGRVDANPDPHYENPAAGPAANMAQPGSGSGQPSGDNPHVPVVENVPHLLWTLKNYIDRLNAGALSTQTLPVVCTHPPAMNPGQRQASLFGQEIQALTASICSVLDSTDLPEALRSQLESAQQGIDSSSDHNENVRFSPWPNPSIISPGDLATAQPYAHLPLLVAALGHLTSRADTLFRERASRSLRNACQQLQAATEVDESNQELLVGGIRQIASVLNWYGALFVELARVAACAVPALQGNVIPLAANTASVIKPDGNYPNFGRFIPRGFQDNQEELSGSLLQHRLGGGLRYLQTQPYATRRNQMLQTVRYPLPENRLVSLGWGRGATVQAPSNSGFDQIIVPSVGIMTVSGQEQDGHGANSMTDRLDVTLIEPSGQMFTATTGNQPQGVPGQRNQGAGDLSSLLGPLVQQIASGVMNNLQTPGHAGEPNPAAQAMQAVASVLGRLSGSQSAGNQSQPQEAVRNVNAVPTHGVSLGTQSGVARAQQTSLEHPSPPNPPRQTGTSSTRTNPQAIDSTPNVAPSAPATAPSPSNRPARLGRGPTLGRGERTGRSGPRLHPGPQLPSQQQQSPPPQQPSTTSGSGPASAPPPDIMSLVGSMLSGGGSSQSSVNPPAGGGGLAQMMESMVNNPELQRMAQNPDIQRMVGGVLGHDSQPQDMGSMLSRMGTQMMPMMAQMLGGGSQTAGAASQPPAPVSDDILYSELPPEESARWKQILDADATAQQVCVTPSEPFSEVYSAGEGLGRGGGLIGLVDGKDDESSRGGDDAMSL